MTPNPTRRDLVAGTAAAAAALALAPAVRAAGPSRIALRLIETSDLHVNIDPYDYYRDKPDDTVGLARTATLIDTARSQARNTLLFDNGDIIQGNPIGDWVAYRSGIKKGDTHPVIAAMNTLDYVCCTLGNHEFNYGLDFLDIALAGANFPATCANVVKADGTPLVKPWLTFDKVLVDDAGAKQTLKVGVIGFVPPQIVQWDKANLDGKATTTDIVEAARRYLPELKAQKPDLVVALCHSGIAKTAPAAFEENAARGLAQVPGIDVIFLGHQHLVFPGKDFAGIEGVDAEKGTINGVPAVMPGFWGSHLGVIDLDLEKGDAGWKVVGNKVEARPIYDRVDRKIVPRVDSQPAVLAAAKPAHDATLAYVREPVGESKAPINSYFSLVADDASIKIVTDAQTWYVKPLAATIPALAGLPVLSAGAPFKSGGRGGPDYYTDVKAGPLAIKDIADIYLYPNTLRAVRIDGATVREWLERSAGIFNTIDPAKTTEQALIDPAFPAFNFDVIDGVTYRIDPTKPSRYDGDGKLVAPDAHRIVDLMFAGKPIDPAAQFLVVTNNYRAGGGGNFPGNDGKTIVINAPDTNRDVVVRYVHDTRVVNPAPNNNWGFVAWPKTAVVTFTTSPAAKASIPADLHLEAMGDAADGFAKYRLVV